MPWADYPKHTAKLLKGWLLYNELKQLFLLLQSSDLNPVEHLNLELERK